MTPQRFIIIILLVAIQIETYSQCDQGDLEFYSRTPGLVADTSYYVNLGSLKGYIFPEGYHGAGILNEESKSITLTMGDVSLIETIIVEQYNEVHQKDPRFSNSDFYIKNPKKYLKKFDRQYLGYLEENGSKEAIVLLADRSGWKKKKFQCFDKIMVIGAGEFYEKNQRILIVQIDIQKLIIP